MAEEFASELQSLKSQLREELEPIYEERGIPTEWQDVTPDAMRPAFTTYFKAFPSAKAEMAGSAEAERLIHNPLSALRAAGLYPDGDEVPDISTLVVNHQHTLNRMVMYASVTISKNPHTIGITLVKEPVPARLQELVDRIEELEAQQESAASS